MSREQTGNNAYRIGWRLLAIASVAITVYFLVSISGLVVARTKLDERADALKEEVASLRATNQQLQEELAWLQTDAALEELARKDLGWVKPGETAVTWLESSDAAPSTRSTQIKLTVSKQPNWERWMDYLFGRN